VKTVGFIFVPLYRMLMHFARILLEMVGLTGHRAKAANCQKSHSITSIRRKSRGRNFPGFSTGYKRIVPRFKHGYRCSDVGGRVVYNCRNAIIW
jgi:hypothetical protein